MSKLTHVGALIPDEDTDMPTKKAAPKTAKPLAKKPAAAKKAAAKKPAGRAKLAVVDTRTSSLPPLEPEMMNDILRAVHEQAKVVDAARATLDAEIARSDEIVREAVDDGERYRDIAAAADRTVPWVQMSLRRVAGVSTHPAAPIPDTRVRKTRAAS